MKIGLLGFGTVGGGVGAIVTMRQKELAHLLGEPVEIVSALVKDIREHVNTPFENLVTEDPFLVIDNPEIEVIFEALGGIETPFEWISRALNNKKHVITANKAVICAHFRELQALAIHNGVTLSVEACVGGGIPIISTLSDHLLFGDTKGIHGILNGTGNYILSKIEKEQVTFQEALSEAQALGYAEQIPDDDVDGFDATRKLLILTALIHNAFFSLEQVSISSIRSVTPQDFDHLKALGRTLRYVVSCELQGDGKGLNLVSRPVAVAINSPFGQTFGPDNTIVFEHSHLNQLSLKGPGAGKYPTANAMIGDLIRLRGIQKISFDNAKAEAIASNGDLDASAKVIAPLAMKKYYVRSTVNALETLRHAGFVPTETLSGDVAVIYETDELDTLKTLLLGNDVDGFIAEMF